MFVLVNLFFIWKKYPQLKTLWKSSNEWTLHWFLLNKSWKWSQCLVPLGPNQYLSTEIIGNVSTPLSSRLIYGNTGKEQDNSRREAYTETVSWVEF